MDDFWHDVADVMNDPQMIARQLHEKLRVHFDNEDRNTRMQLLTKDQILSARSRLKTQVVDVPEWGGSVIVCELTGSMRDAFEGAMVQGRVNGSTQLNMTNVRARLAAFSIVNPDDFESTHVDDQLTVWTLIVGKTPRRMFTDAEIAELGQLSAAALSRVADVAQKLSGIGQSDIQELTGDLKNDQSANSGLN